MKLTRDNVKDIDYEFRIYANRLMESDYRTGLPNLKKFLSYINGESLLSEFVQSKRTTKHDFSNWEIGTVYASLGETPDEEIAVTYDLLTYFVENNVPYQNMAFNYGGARVASDIANFNKIIVLPFILHITGYLRKLLSQMDDDTKRYIINNAPGGQVNIAQDNATINATQNNGLDVSEVQKLIETILNNLPSEISDDEKEDIAGHLDVIREEIEKPEPGRNALKMATKALNRAKSAFPEAVNFANAVVGLVTLLQPYLV